MAVTTIKKSILYNDANIQYYASLEGNSNDSINSNNGTDTDISYGPSYGKFGQGPLFNGSSSVISLPSVSALKPTGNFSLHAWFKVSGISSDWSAIFSSYAQNTNIGGFTTMVRNDTGKIYANLGQNTGGGGSGTYAEISGTSGSSVNDGNYHEMWLVYNGSNFILYLDNSVDQQVPWTYGAGYATTSYQRIGSRNQTGTNASLFNGNICDVALFNRTITPTEISNHWNGTDALSTSSSAFFQFFNA